MYEIMSDVESMLFLEKEVGKRGSAAMLATNRLAEVESEVNLRNPLCINNKARK